VLPPEQNHAKITGFRHASGHNEGTSAYRRSQRQRGECWAAGYQIGWLSAGVYFSGSFSVAGALQDQDLGVVDEPVGNGGGHRGGVEDGSPVGKRQVGGNQS